MKKILFLSAIALLSVSCRNYLDLQPRGSAIPRTAEDFSAILNELLSRIDNSESPVINYPNIYLVKSFADDIDANLMSLVMGGHIRHYVGAEYENSDIFLDRYHKLYAIINRCNVIIQGLESDASELAKEVKGASHAIRGICYYELMRQFCQAYDADDDNQLGLPIVLELDIEARPVRSSMEATVMQIERDLKMAAEYDVKDPMFRFSKDVVEGFLARCYFWAEQYDKAIPLAEGILAAHPLLSGTDYTEMIGKKNGKSGNILLKDAMFATITSDIELTYNNYFKNRPVSAKVDRLFVEKTDDIRYGLWYGISRTDWRIAKKFPLACLRSAEMCLMLAECYYHENNTPEALRYLNMLRDHRITGNVAFTESNLPPLRDDELITVDAKGNPLTPLLYAIHCERRKELFMEGDRWFELKRNGSPEFWIGFNGRKCVTEKFMYAAPLPYHDIVMVDGLIQNPGYEEVKE